jgi:hypothetical protein
MTTPLPISETIDQAIRMFCERLQTPAHGPCEPDTCHPESLCKFQEECPPNKNLAEPVQKLADAINAKRAENPKLAFVHLPVHIPGTFTARQIHNGVSLRLINFYDGRTDSEHWWLSAMLGEPRT